jgi:hypothetical protein
LRNKELDVSVRDCIARVEKASNGVIGKIDAINLVHEIKEQANIKSETKLWSAEEKLIQMGRKMSDEAAIEAAYKRRAALLNAKAMDRIEAYIKATTDTREVTRGQSLVYYMLGTPRLLKTSTGEILPTRNSVYAQQVSLRNKYYGQLAKNLEEAGLDKIFRSGALDEDVFKELWEIANTRNMSKGRTGVKEAHSIAKIIYDLRTEMLGRENRAGGLTKMNENYAMRQTHDVQRIMKGHTGKIDEAYKAWRDYILPRLDQEKTFEGVINPEYRLRQIFDNIVSSEHSHVKAKPNRDIDNGYARPGSLAKRVAARRVIHFKNASSAWDYNTQYGALSIRDGIVTEISRHAGNTTMMENFGADPDGTFNNILKIMAQKDRDFAKTLKEAKSTKRQIIDPRLAFETLMGYKDNPANPTVSRIQRNVLAYQTITKLGGVTLSAIPDKAFVHMTLTYNGLSNANAFLANLGVFKPKTAGEKMYMRQLGVGLDSFVGEVNSRLSMNDVGMGGMYKLQQTLFKLNGMHWWNDIHKGTTGMVLANRLAEFYKTPFDKLPADTSKILKMYGIGVEDWKSIRQAAIYKAEDGTRYLLPENMKNLTDAQAAQHLPKNVPETETNLGRVRTELETKLRTLITDQVDDAVITPGAREKIISTWGTQAGTAGGTFARMFMHFKSFPITVATRVLQREFGGHEATALGRLRANWRIIEMIAFTTVGGYVSTAIKDTSRGGGLGIYGDLLMTEYDRGYNHPASVLAGPTLGTIGELVAMTSQAVRAPFDEDTSAPAGKQVSRLITSNTPYANLFYLKPAIDYLILHRINEYLDPGYLREMEKSIEERNHQQFFVPPSEVINR